MSEPPPEKPPLPPTAKSAAKGPPPAAGASGNTVRMAGKDGSAIRKGKSIRLKPKTDAAEPAGPVEIVSSGEHLEATRVRAKVQGEGQTVQGLNLRQKIMIAMAGVTILPAVLIFIVVYDKAVTMLSREIDAKGLAQARLMASIDPEIWLMAMYQDDSQLRLQRFQSLMSAFDPEWQHVQADVLASETLRPEYERLIMMGAGKSRLESGLEFLRKIVAKRKERLRPDEAMQLDAKYKEVSATDKWQGDLQFLFDPFARLQPLRAAQMDLLQSGEIVQLSVLHLADGKVRSWAAKEGQMEIYKFENTRTVEDLEVRDALTKGADTPVRSFSLLKEVDTRFGKATMRYYVVLSRRHIEEAKGSLRIIIFLPIFFAVLAGLAIAWWMSERISEPVQLLMEDINAVSGGDLDHQTVPHSNDEIGQLALTFNRMTEALKTAHDRELNARALEHELNIASEIQANLVPKKILKLPNYDISAYYRPSKEVGGDYYDFIEIDDDHHGIIVADVSGKGVPGSLVMSMTRAFIRMEAERSRNVSAADTLKRANKMLAADIRKGMFVTAIYCILNQRTNQVAISSAGHNPLLLWRAATSEIQLVNPKGIALGFDKGPVFDRTISEETVQLQPGDRIVMYTDGAVEAMNAQNEEFGDPRFQELVKTLATRDSNQFLNLIVRALDDHKGDAPQHDDITIVTLRHTS